MQEFEIFGELEEKERELIAKRKQIWEKRKFDLNSLDGRRKHYLKTFIHRKLPLASAVAQFPNLFSLSECQKILERHIEEIWFVDRHAGFPTIDRCLMSDDEIIAIVLDKVIPLMSTKYGFLFGDLELLDLFLVKYSAYAKNYLAPHTDGCLLSFSILLNDPSEFIGGGTVFPEFNTVIQINRGDCLVHPGKLFHGGNNISYGYRFLLVGFVETVRNDKFSKKHLLLKDKSSLNV